VEQLVIVVLQALEQFWVYQIVLHVPETPQELLHNFLLHALLVLLDTVYLLEQLQLQSNQLHHVLFQTLPISQQVFQLEPILVI